MAALCAHYALAENTVQFQQLHLDLLAVIVMFTPTQRAGAARAPIVFAIWGTMGPAQGRVWVGGQTPRKQEGLSVQSNVWS